MIYFFFIKRKKKNDRLYVFIVCPKSDQPVCICPFFRALNSVKDIYIYQHKYQKETEKEEEEEENKNQIAIAFFFSSSPITIFACSTLSYSFMNSDGHSFSF
jgi:hypothetical protein